MPAPPTGRRAPARFLDPAVLARIGNLDLVSRTVVDGFVAGLHQAAHLGVSTDFAEHRPYVPGDDVRHVDWRLFGRTDRLYVKTFEAETIADVVLALDVSASMGFGSGPLSKLDYGRCVVACLAELAARARDRVGLAMFDRQLRTYVPPSAGPRHARLQALEDAAARGAGDPPEALGRLATRLSRRGVVVVVSDFYAPPERVTAALGELRARGQDVIALQVVAPEERTLGFREPTVLEDAETGERMPVVPARMGEGYRRLFEAHLGAIAEGCGRRRIDYAVLGTDTALDAALFRYLSGRRRRARRR